MSVRLWVGENQTYKTHANATIFRFVEQQGLVCPVAAIQAWRSHVGLSAVGANPVFSVPIERSRGLLQQVASAALRNSQPSDFGLHSLRAGGASDAEDKGMSLSQIMFMGRWRSPTVLIYLRSGHGSAARRCFAAAYSGSMNDGIRLVVPNGLF